jgi:hypothetical protein
MTTEQLEMPVLRKRFPHAYLLPIIHLSLCLIGMIGYVIPAWSYSGVVLEFVGLADMPVSFVGYILSFHHDTLASAWLLVAGTAWWYLLSKLIGRVAITPRSNTKQDAV